MPDKTVEVKLTEEEAVHLLGLLNHLGTSFYVYPVGPPYLKIVSAVRQKLEQAVPKEKKT